MAAEKQMKTEQYVEDQVLMIEERTAALAAYKQEQA